MPSQRTQSPKTFNAATLPEHGIGTQLAGYVETFLSSVARARTNLSFNVTRHPSQLSPLASGRPHRRPAAKPSSVIIKRDRRGLMAIAECFPGEGTVRSDSSRSGPKRSLGHLTWPIIADGDTEYGSSMIVRGTVDGFSHAGAAGITVED
ncbi:uncharacterized protein BDV14DRAFT_194832 [Aspergillus stella-maris]|uniref:uncharacterized protein n=1 Tax=Aspergillus stella-maris TaxID=1810926 RepID=UPI003CCD880F